MCYSQMGKPAVLSSILFFFSLHVEAQENPNYSRSRTLHHLHPSLAIILVILSVMFFLTFLILAYAKFCNTIDSNHLIHEPNPRGLHRSGSRFSGIDKQVIESLPFFRFSSLKGSKKGLECAVCLSKFEETEILRLLPKCRHAFHKGCIDKWLEGHSSCPLCRYKFNVTDITSYTFSNSLRCSQNSLSFMEDQSLELFVQREQDHQNKSSRFNLGSSLRKFRKSTKRYEEILDQEDQTSYNDKELLHKFKHKIVVSDIIYKSRWSDVNSSDLLSLNSEMLNVMSGKRFSSLETNSGRLGFSRDEHLVKIKEDIERKRLYESKVSKITRSRTLSCSSSNFQANHNHPITSRSLNSSGKRSMSEIFNLSRFSGSSTRNRTKEEKIRRAWWPIARRTVQWFAGQERTSQESENKGHTSNV